VVINQAVKENKFGGSAAPEQSAAAAPEQSAGA